MSEDRWQRCRERFTAQCKAVKELAGGAPRDSRNESLKGESHSREVASGEGTISSQPMSDCKTNHARLVRLEGPLHPSGKDYRCDDCGEIVEVEVKPATIGVRYGEPGEGAK